MALMWAFLRGSRLPMTIAVLGLSLAAFAGSSTFHDPFDPSYSPKGQSVMGRASDGPSVRVLLAGSSGASMKELADFSNSLAKWGNPASCVDQVDPRHFQDDLNRMLAPSFRTIEYVYWNAPESRSQVDYILTLEISVKLGKHSFAENRVDLQGVLSGPDGGTKETLGGHAKSKVGFPAINQHFSDARRAAFDEFAQNLSGSRLLAAYKMATSAPTRAHIDPAEMPSSSPPAMPVATAPAVEAPQKSDVRGGLYDVESKIPFNVLDGVYFDAASGELALIGHHDDRFKGAGISYLQYLATLLECPKPEFSLAWTPDSSRRVDSLLARELTQRESDEQATRLGNMVDSSGQINHTGALMLPALGIYPINDNRAPGDLGVEVQSINGGRVVIMKVKSGSAAEKAGLKPIDFIDSVRSDRPVFFTSEFERQVRFAGAGAVIEVSYERGGQLHTTKATLDESANPDPWYEVNRYDVIGMMYRAAGDPSPADVIGSMGIMNTMSAEKEQKAGFEAYSQLMQSLGMASDFQHLQEVGANSAPPPADAYNFGLKLSMQLDSIFHFSGNPLQNSYKSAVQRGNDPGTAVSQVLSEFDGQMKPKIGELIDRLIFRPGAGFQIPPELVEEEYHIHPQMTPEYLGVPRDSQLARLMLASDYLGKQLANRQDLKRKIPGYQSQVEYQINHPEADHRSSAAYRVWISVAGINAAQSTDGRMLALRDVRMRFNIRETDSREIDLPNQQPGGYQDFLTGLYDQFEQEFTALHELREAAKLATVALWMQKQNPAIRLPAEGRAAWKGPETVDGLVYIYLTFDLHHESKIIKMAEGGVSLVIPSGNSATLFPTDSSVVDLRGSSAMATIFTRPDTATARVAPVGTSAGASPYVAGWVVPVAGGTPGQEAVVLETRLANSPNPGQAAGSAPFGTQIAQPTLAGADKKPGAVGADTKANHQLNAIAHGDQNVATSPGPIEAGSDKARLGFDTGAPSVGAVDASAVQAPPRTPEELEIPEIMHNDPEVKVLNSFKQQAQQAHQAAEAAQAKFEEEQKKDPHSNQLLVLQTKAREAQDNAGSLDNMVKFQTGEVKKKIAFMKINTGEDGGSTPQGQTPPPPPPERN